MTNTNTPTPIATPIKAHEDNAPAKSLNPNIKIANSKFDYLNFQKQIGLIAKQILQKRFHKKTIFVVEFYIFNIKLFST